MTSIVRAIIREGRIDTLEPVDFPEGAQVLVTIRSDEAVPLTSRTRSLYAGEFRLAGWSKAGHKQRLPSKVARVEI